MTDDPMTPEAPKRSLDAPSEAAHRAEDVVIVCEPGCCEGCPDCLGLGLGCHNRPASRLMAEVRRLRDGQERNDDRPSEPGTEAGRLP